MLRSAGNTVPPDFGACPGVAAVSGEAWSMMRSKARKCSVDPAVNSREPGAGSREPGAGSRDCVGRPSGPSGTPIDTGLRRTARLSPWAAPVAPGGSASPA